MVDLVSARPAPLSPGTVLVVLEPCTPVLSKSAKQIWVVIYRSTPGTTTIAAASSHLANRYNSEIVSTISL